MQLTGGANALGTGGIVNGGVNVLSGSFQPAAPGAPVGATLAINGPLTFAPGSVYAVRVTPTAADNATATSATLTGATVSALAGAGTYTQRRYTILTAARGGTTFAGATTNLAFLLPTLSYDGDFTYLTVQAGSPTVAGTPDYRTAAATRNQFAVASGLTNAGVLAGAGTGNPILTGLNQLTVGQAQAAFDALSGEGIAGTQNVGFRSSALFSSTITDALLMSGGSGNSVVVPTDRVTPLAYAPGTIPAPIAVRDPASPLPLFSWRAWGTGFGGSESLRADATRGSAAQQNGIGGGAVGVDYRWAPGITTGVALGGTDGSFSVGARATSGSTRGGHLAVYSLAEFGPLYAASTTSASLFDNRTTRTVAGFGGLPSEFERGSFASTAFRSRIEFGYRFAALGAVLTPFIVTEAAQLRSNGFTEVPGGGPGLFALQVGGRTAASVPMSGGLRLAQTVALGGAVWTPTVQVAFVHEFAPVRNEVATLLNLPGAAFLVDGARPSRNAVQVKAGADVAVLDTLRLGGTFDGEFSGRATTYAGRGSVKVSW